MEGNIKMTREDELAYTYYKDLAESYEKTINELTKAISENGYYQEKYNHTMAQINKLAQMMHDNALMYQNLLDHDAQGKINPYADIERWMNMIFDEDFL